MRSAILMFVAAATIGSCAPSKASLAQEMCEAALKSFLRSPSTYEAADVVGGSGSPRMFIRYDAANAFGTPVRGSASCVFVNVEDRAKIELVEFSMDGAEPDPAVLIAANAAIVGAR
jgi:hypothetical protein